MCDDGAMIWVVFDLADAVLVLFPAYQLVCFIVFIGVVLFAGVGLLLMGLLLLGFLAGVAWLQTFVGIASFYMGGRVMNEIREYKHKQIM